MAITYGEYYKAKDALENLMPAKRDIDSDLVPPLVAIKARELRLIVIGALAELNEEGWEDDE